MNHFSLRRPQAADAVLLHAMDSDPAVMRWINGGVPITLDEFEAGILPVYLCIEPPPFGFWIIEADHAFRGWVSLRRKDNDSAELGYRLPQAAWGRGLATGAARELVCRGFDESSVNRITATTYEKNTASQRVLEKLGFVLVKRFRLAAADLDAMDTAHNDGELWDGDDLLYAISRERTAAISSPRN